MPMLEGQGNQPSTHHHRHALRRRPQHNHGNRSRHLTRPTLFSRSKDLEDSLAWFTGSFEQTTLQS